MAKKNSTTTETTLNEVITATEETVIENKTLTPTEYFDLLKGKRKEATVEDLMTLYDNAIKLMGRYKITGQKSGALKLYNYVTLCEKEISAVYHGINTYIERADLDEYIDKIADKAVVIIELENYERIIPDDIVDKLCELKDANVFDAYFVVFTDYTGKERKKIEKKRREKDPILLGAMKIDGRLHTHLYHIGSWVDDKCDLTLDKLVEEFKESTGRNPGIDIKCKYPTYEDFKKSFEKSGV